MSVVIQPDGSLVFRLPGQTVHVDVSAGAIALRDGHGRRELEGPILAARRVEAVELVRLLPECPEHSHLYLELQGNEILDLGRVPVGAVSHRIAHELGRITGAKVSTFLDAARNRPSLSAFDEQTRPAVLPRPRLEGQQRSATPASVFRRSSRSEHEAPAPPWIDGEKPTIIDPATKQHSFEAISDAPRCRSALDDDLTPHDPGPEEHEATVRIEFPPAAGVR